MEEAFVRFSAPFAYLVVRLTFLLVFFTVRSWFLWLHLTAFINNKINAKGSGSENNITVFNTNVSHNFGFLCFGIDVINLD